MCSISPRSFFMTDYINIDGEKVDTAYTSLFTSEQLRNSDIINLVIGAPGHDILSHLPEPFKIATEHLLAKKIGDCFQYGPEVGTIAIREQLAKFLTNHYDDYPVRWSDLIVTSGATSGLQLCATVLLNRKGVIFVEDPTYFIALSLLVGDLGFKVVPVPMDKEGINLDQLEKAVLREKLLITDDDDSRFWAMVYTIPNFHNPTGVTMSPDRGRNFISMANHHNMIIVCDDVYNVLNYSPRENSFSRLKALDDSSGCVISNGSLSKVLAPGVRLGWIEASPSITSRLAKSGLLLSGGCMNHLMSSFVSTFISTGLLDQHLELCRIRYGDRMKAAVKELRCLPDGWSCVDPKGGYFLWITGPCNLTKFCDHLLDSFGISVLAGKKASSSQCEASVCCNSFRLCIAYYCEEKIVAACRTICQAANVFFRT